MALRHGALFTRVVVLPDKKRQSFIAAFSHDDKGARNAAHFLKFLQRAGMGAVNLLRKAASAKA
jgi:hypothetical protein